MRRWTGQPGQQSQCLLCLFGITKQPATRPVPRRTISTTSVRSRNPISHPGSRSLQLSRRGDGGRNDSRPSWRPSGLGRKLKKVQGCSTSRDEDDDDREPPSEQKLQRMVTSSLQKVYKWINESREKAPSQLQALDPERKHWQHFAKWTSDLVESSSNALRPGLEKHQKQISSLLTGPNQRENLTNYLYFAYLDRVLEAKGMDVTQSMDNSIDLRYPTEWYPEARATPRQIHLHIGPTNSGKTYNALKRLETARSGFYAGPLRLLAHEVYSRFNSNGIQCDLVTGDDVRIVDPLFGAELYSSTVEMVDIAKAVDVAVIDEIQMIADTSRGWAWTRAFVGCKAREIHLCGEARVLPLIKELAASMGDNLHVHQYERLNPLKVETKSLRGDLKNLRKGDCVVTFSIINIHALRKQIERDTGKRVAIVYGSLPPEIRAQQAALFNDPDNDYDYLVASDAIGMGLNLGIKRIVFDSVHKFDGVARRQLSIPQIKQIAGRAGRYRTSHDDMNKKLDDRNPTKKEGNTVSPGYVTCVDEVDLPVIQDALKRDPPPIRQAGLLPLGDFIVSYAHRLPAGVSHEYVMQRLCDAATVHPRFALCQIRDQVSIARVIEDVPGLNTFDRCIFTASPADYRTPLGKSVIRALARTVGKRKRATVADIPEIPLEVLELTMSPKPSYLESLEGLHKSLIVYLWLSYRFTSVFMENDMAFHAKDMTEERIDTYLKTYSANRQLEYRLSKAKKAKLRDQQTPTQSGGAGEDYSEHASEDLAEEQPGYREGDENELKGDSSALPIDWSRRAEESSTEMTDDNEPQQEERAASVNG